MMASGRSPLKQIALPFAEGEASYAERWNDLGIALLRIPPERCTAELASLVRWVFNVTKGGTDGCLTKSFAELAQRPWGLCCGERTAQRTVQTARRYGLLVVEEQLRWNGSQQPNAYRIDWAGVAALKNGRRADGQFDVGGRQAVTPPRQIGHRYKEFSLIQSSINSGPGTAPKPKCSDSDFSERVKTPRSDGRYAAILEKHPILAEAEGRRIAPLPAGPLMANGVFAPLQPKHLDSPCGFVTWHRMQLSSAIPVMGDTEADLLLTLATVFYAKSLRSDDVKKNRVAVFVDVIARRNFLRSLPFLQQARTLLDKETLKRGREWVGLADEPP